MVNKLKKQQSHQLISTPKDSQCMMLITPVKEKKIKRIEIYIDFDNI